MAKRTSKRVSERKKTRTAVRNARKEAKLKREMRKKHKNVTKIPKDYLMTDEEKEQLRKIKEATQERNQTTSVDSEDPAFISELEKCIFEKNCDAFVEIVDFRDIDSSRSRQCEEILKKNSKKIFMCMNFISNSFQMDLSWTKNENIEVLADISRLSVFKKICIFGNPKIGKFLLSKSIEETNPKSAFEFIRIPVKPSTLSKAVNLSNLFRGYIDIKDINPSAMFENCWEYIDQDAIKEYYILGRFDSCGAFLDLLAEKMSKDSSKKKTHDEAAVVFFKDVIDGRIRWIRKNGNFYFQFTGIGR
ncbi:uncharacterized protein VICG_00734 [Vittaforma corneae ATCC 50505]|uniref:Guanine nucleotide-binding protein-like 3 N-terminal domain-containing protein n=1 Tax=Vittaforma corneae (strain ATCC 50505) TaxID=993615 RepID=L2GNY3_VITCO|nr:uncharacterized protein VICG_00734 [Vittaforma corneae ATCC 50505]ELA42334.1 hypothetical protein VICG_00734 [Vittaforma corneae ATCC 50505]